MTLSIKRLIPNKIKRTIIAIIKKEDVLLPENKRAFVFLSADYGNIGDLAITQAQKNFISITMDGYSVFPIPISKTRIWLKSIKTKIRPKDVVTIIGGGNMGSLYPDIEELRQLVIRSFPSNRIICFPQTLDWDNSTESNQALRRIVEIYSQHPDIHVFARESITYTKLHEIFKKFTNVSINLVPDIVMSATADILGAKDCSEPKGILRCLRNDRESALTTAQYAILDDALTNTGYEIHKTDTHAGGSQLDDAHCSKLLSEKLSQFRSAKLVITDRLHGMILCLLSGTPCLVLPNSNHKIRQTWLDWLHTHPRLIFVEPEQFDQIPDFISKLLSEPRGAINQSPINSIKYANLKKALRKV